MYKRQALKTPISVYLTLVPCAISASLTSSCSLAFIVDEFPRLPILSKLMGSTRRSTSLLALLRQAKVSPVLYLKSDHVTCAWYSPSRAPAAAGDYRWVVCCKKKKEHTYRGHHLPWRKKKGKKKKRGAEYGYRTSELRLDSLMVSPPTLQRHELGNSLHATFLYPT